MRKPKVSDLDIMAIVRDGKAIDRAMAAGVRDALRRHKLLGFPIVVWRDGRIVEIPPEEIVIPEG